MSGQDSITVVCDGCGYKFDEPVARLKTNSSLNCGMCGAPILYDAVDLKALIDGVEQSLSNMKRDWDAKK